jgi:hypothetical protein
MAQFDPVGRGWFGGETIGLTRLVIKQTLDQKQFDTFLDEVVRRFGPPRIRVFLPPNGSVFGWGSILLNQRENTSNKVGLHVVELEFRQTAQVVETQFQLTDPKYLLARHLTAQLHNARRD